MDIKQLKKELGLNNSDIAKLFGLTPNGYANSSAKQRYENALCKFYYFLMDREKNGMSLSELQSVVNEKLPIQRVGGMLPLLVE